MELTLTRSQIGRFLHHLHIIPVSKGLTDEWMQKNAPNWTTSTLIDALKKAKAIKRSTKHFSGWEPCVDSVTVVRQGIDPAMVTDVVKGVVPPTHVND
jgi:hypothetical protein